MPFLHLKLRSAEGEDLFSTDLTLHELIPLVRHVTRKLGRRPETIARLVGYRAVITPRYEKMTRSLGDQSWVEPLSEERPPPLDGEEGVLQLSEEDVESYAPTSYVEELEAYYNPGTSTLCVECPERHRCPGSGRRPPGEIRDWIVLDPAAPRSDLPITYLSLHVQDAAGEELFSQEFRLSVLQFLVSMVSELLRDADRLPPPSSGAHQGSFYVRWEGEPRVDSLLSAANRPWVVAYRPSARRQPSAASPQPPAAAGADEPAQLVDWDQIEHSRVVDTERPVRAPETLPRRAVHRTDHLEAVGDAGASPVQVIVDRNVLGDFDDMRRGIRGEIGGTLIGEAYRRSEDGLPWVVIQGQATAGGERGQALDLLLAGSWLLSFRTRIDRQSGDRRLLGWYRFHLLGEERVTEFTDGRLVTSGTGERLFVSREEALLHRSLFREEWRLGLVIDGVADGLRFYRMRGERLVALPGYWLAG